MQLIRSCYRIILLSFFFSIGLFSQLESMTLHSLIICDTLDSSIGDSARADAQQMRTFTRNIAAKTNMKLKETILQGNQVRPPRLFKLLDEMKVAPDDLIVFYFSGHGYRSVDRGDDIWPMLYFSVPNRGVDYTKLTEQLMEKKPRLLLAIADCCNNVIPRNQLPPVAARAFLLTARAPINLESQNLYRLFVETRGTYLSSSSIPGQYSWGGQDGGLFTFCFLDSLKQELVDPDASWEHLFAKAIDSVVVYTVDLKSGTQIPQYLYIPSE